MKLCPCDKSWLCCWMIQLFWPALHIYFPLFQSLLTFFALENLPSFSFQTVAPLASSAIDTQFGLCDQVLVSSGICAALFSTNVKGSKDCLFCLKEFKAPTKKWDESIKKFSQNNLDQGNHYLLWIFFIFLRASNTKQKTIFFLVMPSSLQFRIQKISLIEDFQK